MAGHNKESSVAGTGLTRREFEKVVAKAALGVASLEIASRVGASLTVGLYIQRLFESRIVRSLSGQPSSQFGVHINPGNIRWFGLDQQDTLDAVLSPPAIERARISVPPREVAREEDRAKWNPGVRDSLIREAVAKGKKIDLQLGGFKTAGGEEVNTPMWLNIKHPELLRQHAQLDEAQEVQLFALDVVRLTADHYIRHFGDYIASIQIENEPFSKRLPLTNYRYISTRFNQQEVALVKEIMKRHNRESIPILQNVPLDTPEAWWYVLTHSDGIGINFYNQYSGLRVSEDNLLRLTKLIFFVARVLGKRTFITEYQSAAWLKGDKEPHSPFDAGKRWRGLERLLKLRPEAILLWDVEQLLWRARDFGEMEHIEFLNSLPQLF